MITIDDVYTAQQRIHPYITASPLLLSASLSHTFQKDIFLKLETQLPTGSFKPRPAFNNILANLQAARKQGVVASSSGNFAQGVAYAARQLDVGAIIVMPEHTSPYKIQRTKNLGAKVVLCGNDPHERMETTLRIQKETGRLLLQPYDSDETISGDGTIGLEIADVLKEQLNQDAIVLVPVSGGGLLAGIALTLKTLYPQCHVVGIQPKINASLAKSLHAGHCINVGAVKTIADALVAASPGEKPFQLIQRYVDDVILVEEDAIKSATQFFIEQHKLVVEPAGALPLAALHTGQIKAKTVVCIVSGGNIDLSRGDWRVAFA